MYGVESFAGASELNTYAMLCSILTAEDQARIPSFDDLIQAVRSSAIEEKHIFRILLKASVFCNHASFFSALVEDDPARKLSSVAALSERHCPRVVVALIVETAAQKQPASKVSMMLMRKYLVKFSGRNGVIKAIVASRNSRWFSMLFHCYRSGRYHDWHSRILWCQAVKVYGFLPAIHDSVALNDDVDYQSPIPETPADKLVWNAVLKTTDAVGFYQAFFCYGGAPSASHYYEVDVAFLPSLSDIWERLGKPLTKDWHGIYSYRYQDYFENAIKQGLAGVTEELVCKVFWETLKRDLFDGLGLRRFTETLRRFFSVLTVCSLAALLRHVPEFLCRHGDRLAVYLAEEIILCGSDDDGEVRIKGLLSLLFSATFVRSKAWQEGLEFQVNLTGQALEIKTVLAPFQRWEGSIRSDWVSICVRIAHSENLSGPRTKRAKKDN